MRAFIVRPFGVKNGVDFDRVEHDLLDPALTKLEITGRTTGEIASAGNIRSDMFQLLLTADLVIADISVHNANVFYELGIRHAFRDKMTFLIRASLDEVPFDLKTDRYLSYDATNPGASLQALIAGLESTINKQAVDSPAFLLLPNLQAQDPDGFVPVPFDFQEEVQRAKSASQDGDLAFLASEIRGLQWTREGLRVVGRAQFDLADYPNAKETWEAIRGELPFDREANRLLASIYQKLGDLVSSDQAVRRVLDLSPSASERAELFALLGSNAKTHWIAEWKPLPDATLRTTALSSSFLSQMLDLYSKGFQSDLNHYYSGLNALAAVTITTELATALPDEWKNDFDSDNEAASRLTELQDVRKRLQSTVESSILARRETLLSQGQADPWLAVSWADFCCLAGRRTTAAEYRKAREQLSDFAFGTVRRQLEIYQRLGILNTTVSAALAELPAPAPAGAQTDTSFLLFTGHRVDAPGRTPPRFPIEKEAAAKAAIKAKVQSLIAANPKSWKAITAAANGGDILFLEVCQELGIPAAIYLIIPKDDFAAASVVSPTADWVSRFNTQLRRPDVVVREYQSSKTLPRWLGDRPDYTVWERANLWMFYNAVTQSTGDVALVALWNGEGGDGPGGTRHMFELAQSRGAAIYPIKPQDL